MNYKDDIKAIVFDYDGTLIDFNYKASEYTIKALQLLKDKPYKICLSSGRPCFLGLKAFKDTFGDYPLDYVFGCNGSEFKDIKNNRDELLYKISGEDIRYLYSLLNKEYLVCCVYEGEDILVDKLTDNDEINDWYKARWLKPIKYDISKNISDRSKIMTLNAKADRLIQDEYIKSIADKLSNFTYAYSTSNCFEIVLKE